MSELGRLLKNSKFATLAKPLKKGKNAIHPTHQIVETRKAALDRQEWGLKYALPSKVKSRYITFNNVDSQERIVDFETNGGDLWKRLRFQEFGLAVSSNTKPNPLFHKEDTKPKDQFSSILNVSQGISKLELGSELGNLASLRKEFKEYVLPLKASKLKENGLKSEKFKEDALHFLKEYKRKQNVNKLESLRLSGEQKVHGFGGLSYNLKGRLATQPNGVVTHNVVPGRFLEMNKVAVGGFVGKTDVMGSQQFKKTASEGEPRETVLPLQPHSASMKSNGAVNLVFKIMAKQHKDNYRPSKTKVKTEKISELTLNTVRGL